MAIKTVLHGTKSYTKQASNLRSAKEADKGRLLVAFCHRLLHDVEAGVTDVYTAGYLLFQIYFNDTGLAKFSPHGSDLFYMAGTLELPVEVMGKPVAKLWEELKAEVDLLETTSVISIPSPK